MTNQKITGTVEIQEIVGTVSKQTITAEINSVVYDYLVDGGSPSATGVPMDGGSP